MDAPVVEKTFKIGKTFSTYEDFLTFFKDFCEIDCQPLVINTHNKKQVIVVCRHGVKQKSRSTTGARPTQRYWYKGCKAKIALYKGKDQLWKVTNVDLEHNHNIGLDVYKTYPSVRKLSGEEDHVLQDLFAANAKDSTVSGIMKMKTGKELNRKDIQNLRMKMVPNGGESSSKHAALVDFLKHLEQNEGSVLPKTDDDGCVRLLFISSISMTAAFKTAAPPVVQVDTTFNTNCEKYKLLAFIYQSPSTGKSEVAALAFLSEESKVNFTDVMNEFKKLCLHNPAVFLVDKDFTQITVLESVFPDTLVLLCTFHVIKFMKTLIATALVISSVKEELLHAFRVMLYAYSEPEYEKAKAEFLKIAESIKVRTNSDTYTLLKDYFLKNWDQSKKMWVKAFRKHLPLMGDNTTNRIERSFWTLKEALRDKFRSIPSITEAVPFLVQLVDNRLNNSLTAATLKTVHINNPDPKIREQNSFAALELNELGCRLYNKVLCLMHKYHNSMMIAPGGGVAEKFGEEEVKSYATTITFCDCSYHSQYQAPCRHILFLRQSQSLPLFNQALFHDRYHMLDDDFVREGHNFTEPIGNMHDVEVEVEVNNAIHVEPLTDREKYNGILPICVRLAEYISQHGTPTYMSYLADLKKLEKLVRNGEPIFSKQPQQMEVVEVCLVDANETNIIIQGIQSSEENISFIEQEQINQTRALSSAVQFGQQGHIPSPAESLFNLIERNEIPAMGSIENSNYANMQFKQKIKLKGRPKKPSKQFSMKSFNKRKKFSSDLVVNNNTGNPNISQGTPKSSISIVKQFCLKTNDKKHQGVSTSNLDENENTRNLNVKKRAKRTKAFANSKRAKK